MRKTLSLSLSAGLLAIFAAGCAGPQQKLGRGVSNVTEFARLGEIQRSMEQTALWDGADAAYTTGLIRGINRSVVRTGVGLFEIVTFPIPGYDPILRPGGPILPDASVGPAYPDSNKPALIASPTFETDMNMGFSGGDIAPFVPGSRFRIFDY